MLRIFTRENCPHCEALSIPEGIEVDKINIDKDYGGFRPANVPVMQIDGINYEGPHVINNILSLINNAKNGQYSK